MPRVLVADKLETPGLDLLRQAGFELDVRTDLKSDALQEALRVIGLGRIGREVARRAVGLDMKVIGFDPFMAPAGAAQMGIEAVTGLDQMLPRCDYVTVHTPLTDETRDLLGAAQLNLLPKG